MPTTEFKSIDPLIFSFDPRDSMRAAIAQKLGWESGVMEHRQFPDGETYLRLLSNVRGRSLVLLCSLDRPDEKLLPVLFFAQTARELGAASVGLIAPYLGYMRQDKRFQDGEAITSKYFASTLANVLDWLITVDPHLHRYQSLAEIYPIPTLVLQAAPLLATWIKNNVADPLLIGPDEESLQWVAEVADQAQVPYTVLNKIRRGDREVEISLPDVSQWSDRTPVLVDDIISTANTMIETVKKISNLFSAKPVCVGVHGVFANAAYERLLQAGIVGVVTTNTISHPTNQMDIVPLLCDLLVKP